MPPIVPARGIILPRQLLNDLDAARVTHLPRETGGFLIGMRRGPHIEITGATYQGKGDVATEWSFERLDEKHASYINTAWRDEGHHVSLVGDWHSHPVGDGSPSGMDRQAWRKLSDSGKMDCVGLILGDEGLPRLFMVRRKFPFPEMVEFKLVAEEKDDLAYG